MAKLFLKNMVNHQSKLKKVVTKLMKESCAKYSYERKFTSQTSNNMQRWKQRRED